MPLLIFLHIYKRKYVQKECTKNTGYRAQRAKRKKERPKLCKILPPQSSSQLLLGLDTNQALFFFEVWGTVVE